MSTRSTVFASALALALVVTPTAVVGEVLVHELNVPFSTTVVNECTGEPVAITGTLDLLVAETVSSSGATHFQIHSASKGKGSGLLSVDKYVYSEESNSETTAAGATTMTQTINHFVTSASPTDNFFFKMTFHTTMNKGLVPTALVDKFETGCRG